MQIDWEIPGCEIDFMVEPSNEIKKMLYNRPDATLSLLQIFILIILKFKFQKECSTLTKLLQ